MFFYHDQNAPYMLNTVLGLSTDVVGAFWGKSKGQIGKEKWNFITLPFSYGIGH